MPEGCPHLDFQRYWLKEETRGQYVTCLEIPLVQLLV